MPDISQTKQSLIVILGPTASGKSELAVKIAKEFSGEIVSADSRQIYKGMDIGTAKVKGKWKIIPKSLGIKNKRLKIKKQFLYKGIVHHCIDFVSPKRDFDVEQYKKCARRAVKDIFKRGKIPIICGGSGFWIDSVIYNLKFPKVLPDKKLRQKLEKKSAEELFRKLKGLDPRRAKEIDKFNKRRLIRTLEIILKTKKPIPKIIKKSSYDVLKIGVKLPDKNLKNKIRKRILLWLKQGLIKEVRNLHQNGLSWKRLDSFGLSYRYVSRYIQGLMTKKEMLEKLEKEIWRYAKRQMTWFKRDKEIRWIKTKKKQYR